MTLDLRLIGPPIHRLPYRMAAYGIRGDRRYWATAERIRPLPAEATFSQKGRRSAFRLVDSTFGPWAYRGQYEPYSLSLLGEIVQPGWHVIDVGANQGFYTFLLSGLVGRGGHVIAVEPSARLEERLRGLAAACGNVSVLRAAIGVRRGEGRLLHWAEDAGLSHLIDGPAPPNHDVETVPVVTFAEALALVPGGNVDLIKVDVEGDETPILEAIAELDHLPQALLVEIWAHRTDRTRAVIKALQDRDLVPHIIGRTQGCLRNRAALQRVPVEAVGADLEGNYLLTSLDLSRFGAGTRFLPGM